MKFKRYHCQGFTVRFRTERKNFAQEKFFRDPRISEFSAQWENGEPLNLTHFTKNLRASDFHIHAQLRSIKSIVRVNVRWVEGTIKRPKGARAPFAEDFLRWINQFFRSTLYRASVSANYLFSTSKYASSLSLPWPFVAPWPHMPPELWRKPRIVVGMRMLEALRGASRATVETEVFDDESLWVMIDASYRERLLGLAPEKLLPEFDRLVREYIVKR